MKSFYKGKSLGGIVFDSFNYFLMALFALTIIYPFWNMLILSFAEASEATSLSFRLWNRIWTTNAYSYVFSTNKISYAYFNSIFRTLVGTALTIAVTLMASYSLSKKNLPWRNTITIFYLIPMFFGGGLIPSYLLIRWLGLMDSIWVLIIPGIVSSFNVIIMRNFIMTIDREMEEAAFIDGASYITILWTIIIPLSKPIIATVALWTAVGHWNAWFDAMIYIRDDKKVVLQLLLRQMISMSQMTAADLMEKIMTKKIVIHSSSVVAATTMVTVGPIILVYPFLQKYFVKGIMIGSLKG